jgi:hypothetical protein
VFKPPCVPCIPSVPTPPVEVDEGRKKGDTSNAIFSANLDVLVLISDVSSSLVELVPFLGAELAGSFPL